MIAAGPAVNIAIAFLILAGIYWANGTSEPPSRVRDGERRLAGRARSCARATCSSRSTAGARRATTCGTQTQFIADRIATHKCAGEPVQDCRAVRAGGAHGTP